MAARDSQVRNSTARASTENILEMLKLFIKSDLLGPFVKKFDDLPPYDQKSDQVEIIVDDEHFCDVLNELHKKLCCPGDEETYSLDIQAELYQTVSDCDGVFEAFSRLLETCLRSELLYRDASPSLPTLVTRILRDGADCLPEFAKRLCQHQTLLETILWTVNKLRDKHMKGKLNPTTETILHHCLTIIYKCSREDYNYHTLKKAKVLHLSQNYFDSPSEEMQRVAVLCAVYMAEEKHAKIFKTPKKCRIGLLVEALRAALGEETKMYQGWPASELLKGMGRFALYDCNKKPLVDCGAHDLMMKAVFVRDKPDILLEATTALWTLSFDPLYKPMIRRDKELLDILSGVISGGEMDPCYRSARGLMWSVRDSLERTISESGGALPVQVSYHWSDKDAVDRVCTALKSWAEYKICMDDVNEEGPPIDDMKSAVDQSLVVFVCLSKRYKNSLNCRAGVEYACSRRKEIVPILISHKYKPDGWLGNLMVEKRVYDVTEEKYFDQRMREIIKILESRGM